MPNPFDAVGSLVGLGVNGISSLLGGGTPLTPLKGLAGQLVGVAVAGFVAIIKLLFAPVTKFITADVITWLIKIPNLTGGNVHTLEQTVAGMALGAAGAVATFAIVRFWLAGVIGGPGSALAGLEGLAQTVFAILLIAIWPQLFGDLAKLTNAFTGSLMASHAVVGPVAHLIGSGLAVSAGSASSGISQAFGLFLMIVLAVAASLLFLGLLFMKIMVSASTVLIYVGMPLAIVLWPVAPWIGRMAFRALGACLAIPAAWAVAFATAAAVGAKALTQGAGDVPDTLLQPLVAIVLLWIAIRLPTHLGRVAMLGAAPLGGGFISRAASYAVGSQTRETIRAHLPAAAGGRGPAADSARQAGESRTGQRLQRAARLAGAAATGGTAAAAGTAAAGSGGAGARAGAGASVTGSSTASRAGAARPAAATSDRAYTPPPTAQAIATGQLSTGGLQAPSFAGREQDFAAETFEAEHRARTNPVSAAQAREALVALPATTRQAVAQLAAEHGAGARQHLAYQALGEWSPQERDALRTLAAATPGVRTQATNSPARNANDGGAANGATTTTSIIDGSGTDVASGEAARERDHPTDTTPERSASPTESFVEADARSERTSTGTSMFDAPAASDASASAGEVIDVNPNDVIPPPPPGDHANNPVIDLDSGDVVGQAASEQQDDPLWSGPGAERTAPPASDQPSHPELPPRQPRQPREQLEPRDLFPE